MAYSAYEPINSMDHENTAWDLKDTVRRDRRAIIRGADRKELEMLNQDQLSNERISSEGGIAACRDTSAVSATLESTA